MLCYALHRRVGAGGGYRRVWDGRAGRVGVVVAIATNPLPLFWSFNMGARMHVARHAGQGRRLSRPQLAGGALVAAAVIGVGGAATNAAFTSSAVVEAQVATGTLDININGNQGTADAPYVIPLPAGKFEPGLSKTVALELRNTGSIDATVSGASVVSGTASGLAGQLQAKVTAGGVTLYSGSLDKLALTGVDLAGGATKALSLEISAPVGLANTFQGKADVVTLTVTASQASLT